MSDENEMTFDDMDEEEKEEYINDYKGEVERSLAELGTDRERQEVLHELNTSHNFAHGTDGKQAGRRSFLEAKDALRNERDSDPHVRDYLEGIDKERGKGEGRKLLDRTRGTKDSGYLTDLERKGLI